MKRNLLWLLGLAVATALIVAGCGGGDDDSTTTSLAKPAWIAKADAICERGNQEIEQGANQFQGRPTQAQLEQFATETLIPSVQTQADQIKALGAPSGDEDQVDAILTALQADIDKVKADPSLIQGDPFADANKLAVDYGLKVCGQS